MLKALASAPCNVLHWYEASLNKQSLIPGIEWNVGFCGAPLKMASLQRVSGQTSLMNRETVNRPNSVLGLQHCGGTAVIGVRWFGGTGFHAERSRTRSISSRFLAHMAVCIQFSSCKLLKGLMNSAEYILLQQIFFFWLSGAAVAEITVWRYWEVKRCWYQVKIVSLLYLENQPFLMHYSLRTR